MCPHCEATGKKVGDADEARITSPQETDVTVGLDGCGDDAHPGITRESGKFTSLVRIEATSLPWKGLRTERSSSMAPSDAGSSAPRRSRTLASVRLFRWVRWRIIG
jgi:hypothetical protein